MAVSELPRLMLRRWYVALIGLAITVGLAAAAMKAAPVTYQAKAYVVVIPPRSATPTGGNPLLSLGGLESAADVLSRAMVDPNEAHKLQQQGVISKYTVERDTTTDGPVLVVTAQGSRAADALRELRLIVADLGPTLTRVQQSVSVTKSARMGVVPLNVADQPNPQHKSQLRAVLVAVVVGVVLTLLLVRGVDRLMRYRSRRRALSITETDPPPSNARRSPGKDITAGNAADAADSSAPVDAATEDHGAPRSRGRRWIPLSPVGSIREPTRDRSSGAGTPPADGANGHSRETPRPSANAPNHTNIEPTKAQDRRRLGARRHVRPGQRDRP